MKHRIVKVLAVVFAVSMLSAVGASAATMSGVNVSYWGGLQSSGSAITHLGKGQVAVDVSYVDRRANSYSTYAKVNFYKRGLWMCRIGHPCYWNWDQVAERSLPNINNADGWRTYHQAISVSGSVHNYAARYTVCTDVFGKDPCSTSGLVIF
jgi:hypothetical protein